MKKFWLVVVACVAAGAGARAQTYTTVYSFCALANCVDGGGPNSLSLGTDGNLYGTTRAGGAITGAPGGVVFKVTPSGEETALYSFCGVGPTCWLNGNDPVGIIQGKDGNLYGTTYGGGGHGSYGTVFKINSTGKLIRIYSFCGASNCSDGVGPLAGLVQAKNGNLYGTTSLGGANAGCLTGGFDLGCGSVFEITPAGKLTTLYSFCPQSNCTDGSYPATTLIQATSGSLYGTTSYGGLNTKCSTDSDATGCGTVFKITTDGVLTTVYSFCRQENCSDGLVPSGVMQSRIGVFYGTTFYGGNCNMGTIFRLSSTGKLTTLFSFGNYDSVSGQCQSTPINGAYPSGPLTEGADGNLYGTTQGGGSGYGTIFRITPAGKLATLYSFCSLANCADGWDPVAGVIQAADGVFYGTTDAGGANSYYPGNGTVFSLSIP